MPITKNRRLAKIIDLGGKVKTNLLDSDTIVTSGQKGVEINAGVNFTVSSVDTLPVSTNTGHTALDTSTNRLYIFNGSGWYHIATINNFNPQWITQPNGSYALDLDGSTTTITVLASDSDDVPITYIAVTDSNFDAFATVAHDSDKHNVWTVTPTATTGTYSGTITFKASDGINLVQAASSFSLTFTTTNSRYTYALTQADDSETDAQVDASSNSHTITENGNVTSTAFTPHHPGGYSTYFDGSGDNIEVAEHTSTRVGSSDFTIEAWIYNNEANSTGLQTIFSQGASGVYSPFNLYFSNGGSGQPAAGKFVIPISSTGSSWDITDGVSTGLSSGTYDTHTWHHVALVREGSSFKLYVNGTLDSTIATSSATLMTPTEPSSVGARRTLGESFGGWIKDVRLVIGTAVYTGNFTPPTESLTAITNTKLLLCSLPYLAEASGNANGTISEINGTPKTERFGPYDYSGYTKADHGGSVYFDGAGDYLSIPDSSDFDFGNGDFTIEFWAYQKGVNADGTGSVVGQWAASNRGWVVYLSSTFILFSFSTNGSNYYNVSDGSGISYNEWTHVAIVRDGNTMKMYKNGTETYNAVFNSTIYNSSRILEVGANSSGTYGDYLGYLSDVRIVKGTAVYTSAFTPPTAPLSSITNTKLLTCTNKNNIWDAAAGAIITKTGQVTTNSTTRKWTTVDSTYHQGSNDWYGFTLPSPLADDFTVEMWVNHQAWDSTTTGIWDFSGAYGLGRFGAGSSARLAWWDNNANVYYIQENAEMDTLANTWWHFALCRTGGNSYKAFVNGTQEATWTLSGGISQTVRIGNDQVGGDLLGYVQDVRVTNGLARYTTNFTVPSAQFEG
tara:strand:- start:6320 stop:8857 length:2538 start_codon:yes stop_codon:yes gene_type:complete